MAKQSDQTVSSGSGRRSKQVLSGRQKAAVFLVTLGSEISSEIFKHLREDEIETLTFEIARLENFSNEDKAAVLQEFQELMMAQDFINSGGIDYARELLEKSLGSQKAVDIINRLTTSLQVRPFDFIRRTDPTHLLNFIQQEHPQTIALILAYLEPQKASIILGSLPNEIQSDVAKRIATMDRTSPETLREVERVLEKKLASISSEDYTPPAVSRASSRFSTSLTARRRRSSSRASKKRIRNSPRRSRSACSSSRTSSCSTTGDPEGHARGGYGELAKALKAVDYRGSGQDLPQYVQACRRAAQGRHGVHGSDPHEGRGRKSQQKIVSIIRKLEEQGEIVVARAGEDELVV
jgi:flagellar motor switch protein FliG